MLCVCAEESLNGLVAEVAVLVVCLRVHFLWGKACVHICPFYENRCHCFPWLLWCYCGTSCSLFYFLSHWICHMIDPTHWGLFDEQEVIMQLCADMSGEGERECNLNKLVRSWREKMKGHFLDQLE